MGVAIAETELENVLNLLVGIGPGFLLILAIYLVGFVGDALAWQIGAVEVPITLQWLWRFFIVRLAGESFNTITPAAGMGGEPVKAALLKSCYGVGYHEAATSQILSKTTNTISLVLFLGVGFVLILLSDKLGPQYWIVSGVGILGFALGAFLFFAIQRYKVTSLAGSALARSSLFRRIKDGLHHLIEVEDRLIHFYTERPIRMSWAIVLGFFNWVVGIVEIQATMWLIGHPVGFADAWIIEALTQLVRAATFFIPASLGAQDGTFLVVISAITGQPPLGLTVALARRVREIAWSLLGLFTFYRMKPTDDGINAE
jgi:uncharacterized protein (TIRG00374 family)